MTFFAMNTNYLIIGLVLVLVIVLIVWLIKKNQKDRKDFEKAVNASDVKPEQHENDQM